MDTISIILVPEEAKDDTFNKMSPRVNRIYKKNLKNIFEFNHETLNGLACASEYKLTNPDDLENPKYFYDSYAKLLKDVEVDHVIDYGTPITFTGKVGDIEYKNKTTSYGRLRLSKIIGADIDEIKVNSEPVLSNKFERINGKSAAKLMSYLYTLPDGVERARDIQKWVLKVVTKCGVVTFDYTTLFANTDNELYKEIRKIADSTELTDKQKLLLITEKWGDYEKSVEKEFSSDLKKELDMAGRVKLSSIVAMSMPQFIVSGVGEEAKITKKSLLEGYDEEDYQIHAIENRSLQSIKQSGVNLKRIIIRNKWGASKTTKNIAGIKI